MDVNLFFKEVYSFEIERRDKLDAIVGVLLTAITGVIVAIVFVLGDKGLQDSYPDKQIVTVTFSITIFMIGISAIFLVTGFHGRVYKYVDYSDKLKKYYDDLNIYHSGSEEKTQKEFFDSLTGQYIKFSSHNAKANDEKSENYFQARQWFSWSLLPFACGAIAYGHYVVF